MLKMRQKGEITSYCMGRSIGPFVPYTTHSFLIKDILIDTGTIYAQDEFLSALKGKKISSIINTHHHEDHIGNNHAIQKKFGSTIYAHKDTLPFLLNPKEIKLRFYQRVVWNWPQVSLGQPLPGSISCSGYTFNVIHTPGHSPDHICLHEPERKWLFTGDIFCGKNIRYMRQDEDFDLTLSSLKKIATLDIEIILCSLKGIVEDGRIALKIKIDNMEEFREKVLKLKDKGLLPSEIKRILLGREDHMFYLSNTHFSKQNIINSILSSNI